MSGFALLMLIVGVLMIGTPLAVLAVLVRRALREECECRARIEAMQSGRSERFNPFWGLVEDEGD